MRESDSLSCKQPITMSGEDTSCLCEFPPTSRRFTGHITKAHLISDPRLPSHQGHPVSSKRVHLGKRNCRNWLCNVDVHAQA